MNGPDNYQRSEELVQAASFTYESKGREDAALVMAEAQVHATLAMAAAIALAYAVDESAAVREWLEVIR